MKPDELLQPSIPAAEIITAFQLLFPKEFEAVLQVIGNAKRNALIPEEDKVD